MAAIDPRRAKTALMSHLPCHRFPRAEESISSNKARLCVDDRKATALRSFSRVFIILGRGSWTKHPLPESRQRITHTQDRNFTTDCSGRAYRVCCPKPL